jgi:hypothetical protein
VGGGRPASATPYRAYGYRQTRFGQALRRGCISIQAVALRRLTAAGRLILCA